MITVKIRKHKNANKEVCQVDADLKAKSQVNINGFTISTPLKKMMVVAKMKIANTVMQRNFNSKQCKNEVKGGDDLMFNIIHLKLSFHNILLWGFGVLGFWGFGELI